MAAASHRMSKVDTAWLRMDNDVNLMMIVGVWMLSADLPQAVVVQRLQDKLLKYPRFRQVVVQDAMGAQWVEDEAFDMGYHARRERLPRRPGQCERQVLQARVAELATQPLDPSRPLWQMHWIEDYEGASAMIMRIHHCIGDGISLISVMLSITDGGADPPQRRAREAAEDTEADWLVEGLVKPLTGLTTKAIDLSGEGVSRSLQALADPSQRFASALHFSRVGAQVLGDVAALATLPDDSATPLKGPPAGRKRVAWSEPLPLDDVKAVGKALGASVNDVLTACVAGALAAYLRERGHDCQGAEIRAMVPVNLRPMDQAWKLGNRFGLVPLLLPLGVDNPVQRVFALRARMTAYKTSYQPLLVLGVLALAGVLIKPAQDALLGLFAKKATAVMTNVPGPAQPLKFCGTTLKQTMFWVPASGDLGVGVSVLTYAGGVQFGLITDEALCPDPQAVIDRFGPEFERLLTLTLMLPWGAQA